MSIHERRASPFARLTMVAAAIGLFLAGYFWGNRYQAGDSPPPAIEGILIRPARLLPGFTLQDASGQPFTAESFNNHWTLLSFGDPSQAPGHLAITRLIEVHNRLAGDPDLQERLQIALATQKPDATLARDFGRLSPAFRLLSGEQGEARRLQTSVGALPLEWTGEPTDLTPFYLIGPSGRLIALFPGAQAPAAIAADLSNIAKHINALDPAAIPTDD